MADARTMAQQRAAHALEQVRARTEGEQQLNGADRQELRSRANDLPALIHRSGLGQAMALYRAKHRDAHDALYDILGAWLCQPGRPFAGYSDLLDAITAADADHYRAAQAEAQELLIWVKQFVRAFVPPPGAQSADPKEEE